MHTKLFAGQVTAKPQVGLGLGCILAKHFYAKQA